MKRFRVWLAQKIYKSSVTVKSLVPFDADVDGTNLVLDFDTTWTRFRQPGIITVVDQDTFTIGDTINVAPKADKDNT